MKSGTQITFYPVSGGELQNTLTSHLQRGKTSPNECPVYDTKQSAGQVPVILDLWEMWSTPSSPSFLSPRRPGVETLDGDQTLDHRMLSRNSSTEPVGEIKVYTADEIL